MQRGAIFSVILHLAVILLAVFGLPRMVIEPPEPERPIVVELAQIGDITNPPPAPQPQQQQEEPAKPEPPKPEPKSKPVEPPPPPPPPKPAEPEPVTLPSPKDKKAPEEKKPEADKPSPLSEVKPKKKPEPPQDDFIKNVLKSVDKPKPQPDDFDKMMKKLTEATPKKDEAPKQAAATPQKAGSPTSSLNQQYTITEQDFIRAYIQKNWNPPVGAKEVVVVQVSFTLRADGTITDVRFEDTKSGDVLWQSFADSARRAVLLSSPIPIPQKSGRADDRVVVTFDPREMMGYSKR